MSASPDVDGSEERFAAALAALEAEVHELRERLAEALLEKRIAQEEARRQSLVDELTGLHNRQGFLVLAEQQLGVLKRSGAFGGLVVADIDGLRALNDAQGHAAGDRLIVATARALRSVTRGSDIVGRVGGDEFGVFLACDDPAVPELVVARIERAVAEVGVSLSIGVATGEPAGPATIEELVSTADAAMYRAKQLHQAPASGRR